MRKPPVDWEILPPEIWTLIFRHATLVPDLTSTDLCNYGMGDPINCQQRKLHKRSLRTKQILVRVCKTWYTSAIRFLNEAVLLGRGKSLASLHKGLQRSHRSSIDSDTGELPLGWWTKRLDVAMRDSTNDAKSDMVLVGRIVAMLPNLSILTFNVRGHGYFPAYGGLQTLPSSILQSTSPENLNVVYWHSPHILPTAEDWVKLLSSRPHLRSMSDFGWGEYRPVVNAVPNLPSLTSLHLSFSWSIEYFSRLELPHLQHLTYRANSDFTTNFAPFLQNHGAKLMSFTTDYHTSEWNMLPLVSETCPNLISLELSMDDWIFLPGNICALPPIRLMKLTCRRLEHGRHLYRRLFPFIIDAMTVCPTLKTVRFADERVFCDLNNHLHVFQGQLKTLLEAGVTFENAEGRLIALS